MNPLAIPLPLAVRRPAEIFGVVTGLLCFAPAFFAGWFERFLSLQGPATLALPIVVLSAIAGALASATADPNSAPDVGGVPLRVGARAGYFASLVGGAATVFAATLHTLGMGMPPEDGLSAVALLLGPTTYTKGVVVLALLALPPSIFFGLTGAFLAGMLKGNASAAVDGTAEPTTDRHDRGAVFVIAILLTAAGYLSPFLVLLKPAPKPPQIAAATPPPAPASIPKEEPPPPPPPPPKWRYKKPADFDGAEAGRIVMTERRTIGDIAENLPVAMSPNGNRLAYFRDDSQIAVHITDLETLDGLASLPMTQQPASLAWSPDSRMLLIVTEGAERSLFVFDVWKSTLTALPQPRNARVPAGRPDWWDRMEVLFLSQDAAPLALDLDTLRVGPVENSAKWKGLSETERKGARRPAVLHLPRNDRWQMTVEGQVRNYDVPLKASENWPLAESMQLAFIHPKKTYRYVLPPCGVGSGHSLVAANDGTKLVHIHQNNAVIEYFGLRPQPPRRFTVLMPSTPEASLAAALAKKNVAAFVCPPLINPLNGRTVGPNRTRVKAIARIANWQEKTAEFWIDEDYMPLESGDVVADIHTWEGRKPRLAGDLGKGEWFAVIDKLDASTPPPAQSEAPPLDRVLQVHVDSKGGVDRILGVNAGQSGQAQPASDPRPPLTAPFIPEEGVQRQLLAFIARHHEKSSRGDVDGLVADYGERVDHFTNGIVSRDFVRKDESEYHAPGSRVTETIITQPVFARVDPTSHSASYSIKYHRIRPDGRWTKGISDITLTISIEGDRPYIVRQRAQNHHIQKGP